MSEGPWSFFQDLIVIMQETKGMDEPRSLNFNEVSFWVQCHNVPLSFSNKNILENIGAHIGLVEEVDQGESGSYLGSHIRIQVRLDIRKPLNKFVCVGVEDEEDVFILLTYERIPNLCYRCGVIGHSFRTCGEASEKNDKLKYGIWMKS
ncbi:uncharacterized protein [Henckelia pumila]|uniref:uncharacterized protein n=1 Tax=Henckelia pumila TaxID=405737 RepID=UPI003C6E0214